VRDPNQKLFCIYSVQSGDTLSSIAAALGVKGTHAVSGGEMLAQSNKPEVVDSDEIAPGQKLRIPLASGIIHTAFTAETIAQLAEDYGISTEEIEAANAGIGSELAAGQELLIPSPLKLPTTASTNAPDADSLAAAETPAPTATPTAPPATSTPQPTATQSPPTVIPPTFTAGSSSAAVTPSAQARTPAPATATATPRPSQTATPPPKSRAGFIWPASGPISSPFGASHPLGIDIDFYANPNQGVVAAAAGTVTFAGGDPCCSYGYYVIIDHGNGFTTLYAHFSRYVVSAGQKVTQGQLIGYGGKTGYATGEHLHFEMRYQSGVVNPVQYLP
jgi:murein DD-endopeptidase MepM/ murein hydrolase activator NlpD